MFNVNNKNSRTTSEHAPFPSVSIVEFEQANVSWKTKRHQNCDIDFVLVSLMLTLSK